ncbi:MAG: DegT/DnrJ/EryC1/StrS family aminotransferase [Dehalococcoidia bacterium]
MTEALAIDGGTPVRRTPFASWPVHDEREVQALREVIESGNWGGFPSPNERAARFAEAFASYHTARFGVCTASGTTALEVALKAAGVEAGDEVIMPALTFVATAAAALYMGAVPVFVDIDPESWCLDPAEAERAVTERTKAILPVHLGSRMADMDGIMALARGRGLRVIEDCAHMHGGFWRDKGAGSIGDLGCFSFQSTKLMTSGEGGIIIANDDQLAARCGAYVDCGRVRPGGEAASSQGVFGWNYRMTEFQAAVLEVQLERLPEQVRVREANKQLLTERLEQIEGVSTLPQDERMTQPSGYGFYFRYCRDVCGGKSRNRFVGALRHEGIPCYGDFYSPVYKDTLFAWRDTNVQADYSNVHCPIAERVAEQESVWLPHELFLGTTQDVIDIATAVEKVTGAFRASGARNADAQ